MKGGSVMFFVLATLVLGAPARSPADERPIVAVFRIQDRGANLNAVLVESLTEYLAASIAEGGVLRVVPTTDIRRLLAEKKRESYKSCYDQKCQIELGRELSAGKSLSASILRFGESCTVTATLYDLKTQATDISSKARGPCSESGYTDSIDRVSSKIRAWASGERRIREPVEEVKLGSGKRVIVHFSSSPPGAVVHLDGKLLCVKTPCSKAVPAGAHQISMQAEKCQAKKERVVLARGDKVNWKLTPNFGIIDVHSTPLGREVSLNGRVVGRTPLSDYKVDPGKYEVLVAGPCHYAAGERVRVARGQKKKVEVKLKDKQGALRIGAKDSQGNDVEAHVYVDGARIGTTPGDFKVSICAKELVVRHPALGVGRAAAKIKLNRRQDVQVALSEDVTPMVLIKAGEFNMGSPDDRGKFDEHPRHVVRLSSYWIDKFEVTVHQYSACVEAEACDKPAVGQECNWNKAGRSLHPVNCVSWHQAEAFCRWAGKRLCSEAEWEKAARGKDGREYPWGDGPPRCDKHAVCSRSTTQPVGSRSAGASPYQVMDMAGNVWEWVADRYNRDYYPESPKSDPPGPDQGSRRVNRGGGFADQPEKLRAAYRWWADPLFRGENLGLRCCSSAP
jgi:formylglycine-generating enzyme required for sulfatase activity